MSHDALCALSEPCDDDNQQHGYLEGSAPRFCIYCQQWCICEQLDKARADEREQAARRVEALCWHTKHEGSLPCAHDEAAAAVRGVQP